MRFNPLGIIVVFTALATPLFWFAPLAAGHDTGAVFSQYLGSAALIGMALSHIIATRLYGLESVFGGLDRMYVWHKWLGIGSVAAVLIHDTIDAEIDSLRGGSVLSDLAETLGEISLYGFLALIIITIATFIPYQLWRWTHRMMGAFFAVSAFHFFFIEKPFSVADALGVYVSGWCVAGILAYTYTLFPVRTRYAYKVASVDPTGDSIAVSLNPVGPPMHHKAGQFAFLKIQEPKMDEVHPFTISSAPAKSGEIRFTIKPLGDYTDRLEPGLKPGAPVQLEGPYGHFTNKSNREREIWIGAGVGITPFLARANELQPKHCHVDLFYCVRRHEDAAHQEELLALGEAKKNLAIHIIASRIDGRLTIRKLAEVAGSSFGSVDVSFCGPEAMRDTLRTSLTEQGLPASRFHYEKFEIRSGIGLRKLARTVARSLMRPFEVKKYRVRNLDS